MALTARAWNLSQGMRSTSNSLPLIRLRRSVPEEKFAIEPDIAMESSS